MAATTSRASSAYASASLRPVAAAISPLVIRRMVAVTTSPTNPAGTCRKAPGPGALVDQLADPPGGGDGVLLVDLGGGREVGHIVPEGPDAGRSASATASR